MPVDSVYELYRKTSRSEVLYCSRYTLSGDSEAIGLHTCSSMILNLKVNLGIIKSVIGLQVAYLTPRERAELTLYSTKSYIFTYYYYTIVLYTYSP